MKGKNKVTKPAKRALQLNSEDYATHRSSFYCSCKYITLWRVLLVVPALAIIAISVLAAWFIGWSAIIIPIFTLPILVFLWIKYIPLEIKSKIYRLSPRILHIESGVIVKRHLRIPRSNIQYLGLRRTPVHRFMGLSTVEIMLGAGVVRIYGIAEEDAESLRRQMES
ncbi:MAG: PH domain-containing protein [Oscillospiraceae bacterium]|nr:PH domain-containing protein [Oscillospiraceae bacterium]